MNYSDADVLDIVNGLKRYPGVIFHGEVDDSYENIFSYWKSTIGLHKGFAQVALGGIMNIL